MATTRACGDLDADGQLTRCSGACTATPRACPGDLRVDRGKGLEPVPVENGIKSVLIAKIGATTRPRRCTSAMAGWPTTAKKPTPV